MGEIEVLGGMTGEELFSSLRKSPSITVTLLFLTYTLPAEGLLLFLSLDINIGGGGITSVIFLKSIK